MTGSKKNRKADFELFEKIFNDNEYHPVEVISNFDKNFWVYSVRIQPKTPDKSNYMDCTGINVKEGIKLKENDFHIIKNYVKFFHLERGYCGWGYDSQTKLRELFAALNLELVRDDEWSKYTSKNWSYRIR